MRAFIFLIALTFISCGGSLSNEQRRRIKESMKEGEIKRVSDADLTEAAFSYARIIATSLESKPGRINDKKFLDSLGNTFSVQISFLDPTNEMLKGVEKALIEAYTTDASASLPDNIQKVGHDSLLYTKPFMHERPDGSQEFVKALAIRVSKKQVIRSMK
ncbi:MAG: hypothetical protein JSS93_14285 [Bacteroidetes bacterium]|nr:hypothetical protein [Bacteroidota bacterium]